MPPLRVAEFNMSSVSPRPEGLSSRSARPPARLAGRAPGLHEVEARLELRVVAVPRVGDVEKVKLPGSTGR